MHEYFYVRSKWPALEVTFPFLIIIPCEKNLIIINIAK